MRILFISNNYPPEVNAPATRLSEHAKHWVKDGLDIEVLTSAPNFPEGKVYEGYENKFIHEEVNGVKVTRVPMYVSANEGILKRTLSFVTFMISTRWYAGRLQQKPDVVVSTSPQFFAGIAGYLMARYHRVPFILEIRDLWPESIVAVGAMKRNAIIRFFESIELFLYKNADHIVALTNAFKRFIAAKGIPEEKITVLKNGADLEVWNEPLDQAKLHAMRKEYGLEGKFVASYVGTIGMAHRADVLLEAAQRCSDPDIVFMIVGTGAQRKMLEERQAQLQLPNFRLIDKVPRSEVPYLLALTDASVVHLKASDLFKTVIPSKIFEAMATQTPIILGVEGESKEIVEEAGAGIPIPPENVDALVEAVVKLKTDSELYTEIGRSGYKHVHEYYDRSKLARRFEDIFYKVTGKKKVIDSENRTHESVV